MNRQKIIDRQDLLAAFQLHSTGQRDKAQDCYRQILGADPNAPDSLHMLGGLAYGVGDVPTAIALLRQAIAADPASSNFYHTLGAIYKDQGSLNPAAKCFQKALELNPAAVETLISLGRIRHLEGRLDDAQSLFRTALELSPHSGCAQAGLGNILKELGRFEEAALHYDRSIAVAPNTGTEVKSALLLPVIPESAKAIRGSRLRLLDKIGLLKTKNAAVEDPYKEIGCTNFFLAYHGLDNRRMQEKIAELHLDLCPDLSWTSPHCHRLRPGNQKISIGIISRFLRQHTIGYLNYGIIKHLNRDKFQIHLFCLPGETDSLARKIRRAADSVIELPDQFKKARQVIADYATDILFYPDIGMEPFTYFMAFSRLAPVQCTTWGHADTTGVPNMDYYLTSVHAEPPDPGRYYTEQVVPLERFPMYCRLPKLPDDTSFPLNFNLPEDCNLYICPQSLFKFHPDFDPIIDAILRRDTNGILLTFEGKHKSWSRQLKKRLERTIPETSRRIIFHSRVPADQFLKILMQADVALDPLHFGGGYTSLLCLACGLPIVTLPGAFMRGRMAFALYKQMGIFDCVAFDRQSYVDIAVKLANQKEWRINTANRIKQQAPALFEDPTAVHEIERFFEWSVKQAQGEPPAV